MIRTEGFLQRPLRSHRQNKTSQGTRTRDRKPLMPTQDHANLVASDYGDDYRPASGEPLNLVVKGSNNKSSEGSNCGAETYQSEPHVMPE